MHLHVAAGVAPKVSNSNVFASSPPSELVTHQATPSTIGTAFSPEETGSNESQYGMPAFRLSVNSTEATIASELGNHGRQAQHPSRLTCADTI